MNVLIIRQIIINSGQVFIHTHTHILHNRRATMDGGPGGTGDPGNPRHPGDPGGLDPYPLPQRDKSTLFLLVRSAYSHN